MTNYIFMSLVSVKNKKLLNKSPVLNVRVKLGVKNLIILGIRNQSNQMMN